MASESYNQTAASGVKSSELNGICTDGQNTCSQTLQLDTLLECADIKHLTLTRQGHAISPQNDTYNHCDNRGNTYNQSGFGMGESCFSQYAMDAIFKNLIYPDVCQGELLSLDTLVQDVQESTTHEHRKQFFQPESPSTKIAGKRKRSHNISCDAPNEETGKGQFKAATVRRIVTRHTKS